MKQVFWMVGAALLSVAVLFVAGGLLLSNRWDVERSVLVHAPVSSIHPWVENLQRWSEWESKKQADRTLTFDYAGPAAGVGATRNYSGQYAGKGSTTITQSDAQKGVWFDSRVNSQEVNAQGSITYTTQGASVRVTWRDQGKLPLILGGYLRDSVEDGLQLHLDAALLNLKHLAETSAQRSSAQ